MDLVSLGRGSIGGMAVTIRRPETLAEVVDIGARAKFGESSSLSASGSASSCGEVTFSCSALGGSDSCSVFVGPSRTFVA